MNNPDLNLNPDSPCNDFAVLISTMIDGELEHDEQVELQLHLDHCQGCQDQIRRFERVDTAVRRLSQPPPINGHRSFDLAATAINPPCLPIKEKPKRTTRPHRVWRLVPLAAAATLLVCLGITAIPPTNRAAAGQISAEQIVRPMKDLQLINVQQQRDQDLMLRTLVMDLRSLKLETARLDPDSIERHSLESKINALIDKVNRFDR